MPEREIPKDYRVDIGRADKGRTFIRVVDIPTGRERSIVGIGTATVMDVADRLVDELMSEPQAERGF